jgi:alpha-L-rhamnosidase
VLPWRAWRQYGDTAIIDRFWLPMRRFLDFIQRQNPDYLWKRNHIKEDPDWLEGSGIPAELRAPKIPVEVFATAYWAHCLDMVVQMAQATARDSEAAQLRAVHRQVLDAFNSAYVRPDGTVGSGSQTCYVLALHFGLLPESMRARVAQRLVAEIERCGNAITTGTLATEFILDVLVDHGYPKLAYDLLLRTDRPSWGYMIRNGATGVWETWDNERANSQPALGCIGGFMYRRIAGIAAGTPGFEAVEVRPVLDARITSGGGNYDSAMGRISTDWTRFDDGRLSLAITIPANTSARVLLPTTPNATIHEGRKPVAGRKDVKVLQRSESEAVLGIGSGSYRFIVQ